jgi:hypothetical protein
LMLFTEIFTNPTGKPNLLQALGYRVVSGKQLSP